MKHVAHTPERGAALLAAMLTVALVASLAAGALWQQWRSVEIETADISLAGRIEDWVREL